MTRPDLGSHRVYELLMTRGWCPARWAHHPPEIKRAIRLGGWRPQVKQCFANCQRFVVVNAPLAGLDVEYREGYVISLIPVEHAWLVYKGEIIDLTLPPERANEYLGSYTVSAEEILEHARSSGYWGPVRPRDLAKLSPFYEGFQRLMERQDKGKK